MGNPQNRRGKRRAKKFKDGEPSSQNPGPSQAKLGDFTAKIGENHSQNDSVKEGTVFMDLEVLFRVFGNVLKCPDCGNQMSSHIDMKKKNGFLHYIVLQCSNTECDWKYCFHTSTKQGPSYTVNTRAVLAFREIGRGHSAMITFAELMNMLPPPTSRNFMKIQNNKLLPNDSMLTNAMNVKDVCGNDMGECGISLDGSWQKRGHASHNGVVTAISLDTKKCFDV